MASDDSEPFDRLRLPLLPGVGPRLRKALLDALGSPTAVFAATGLQLRDVPGIGRKLSEAILEARQQVPVAETIELCRQHGLKQLTDAHEDYPRRGGTVIWSLFGRYWLRQC
jgi:DNA processing protein